MPTAAHIVCNIPDLRPKLDRETGLWNCGDWDVSKADAERLVDGMLYLHESKRAKSFWGGRIVKYAPAYRPDLGRPHRIVFIVQALHEGRHVAWRGRDDTNAHYSGVIEIA